MDFIWTSGDPQTAFHTWVQNRWPRTEENRAEPCWTALDPELSCVTTHLQHCGCSCSVLPHMRARILCTGSVWPQLSLYLHAGLRGKADLSWSHFKESWKCTGFQAGPHGCCFLGLWEQGSWVWTIVRRGWRGAETGGEAVGVLLWSKSCVCLLFNLDRPYVL